MKTHRRWILAVALSALPACGDAASSLAPSLGPQVPHDVDEEQLERLRQRLAEQSTPTGKR